MNAWIVGGIITLCILVPILFGYFLLEIRRRQQRRIWTCVRYMGGGRLITPREMTDEEAQKWLTDMKVEVMHIDHEYSFIFYRPQE